jgi:hypothetical protein
MFTALIVYEMLISNKISELTLAYKNGQLEAVQWAWVVRKLGNSVSLQEIYNKITQSSVPICKICKKNEVSQFISFSKGYNSYCSKSCAKSDPLVELKKKASQLKNPEWKLNSIEKRKQTNLEKYGAEHALQNAVVLEKRKQTNLSRYGTDEVLRTSSPVRQNITADISKIKISSRINSFDGVQPLFDEHEIDGSKKKYKWSCTACSHIFFDNLFCGNIPRCPKCFPRTTSRGELEIFKYVSTLLPEREIKQHFRLQNREIDVYVPDARVGIEFNGIYWHSEKLGTDKNYHLDKKNLCASNSIRLLQFWDYQWETKQEIVKSIISTALGCNSKIFARKCKIKEISEKESRLFLEENHLAGSARGSFLRLGAFHADELVFVMTFSKSRFSKSEKQDTIELLRMCSKKFTTIIGGPTKMLQFFRSQYYSGELISFCDEMAFSGDVYRQLGFNKIDAGKPAAWYFGNDGELKHRMTYQKKRLLHLLGIQESELTEWQLAQQLGLNRVWDCGSSKWKLDAVSL